MGHEVRQAPSTVQRARALLAPKPVLRVPPSHQTEGVSLVLTEARAEGASRAS